VPQAVNWIRKAAEQGYAPAQKDLGQAYISGDGVAQDAQLGMKWLRTAADSGYAGAHFALR